MNSASASDTMLVILSWWCSHMILLWRRTQNLINVIEHRFTYTRGYKAELYLTQR